MGTHIKDLLGDFLNGKKKEFSRQEVVSALFDVYLSDHVKEHIRPDRIYKETLIVRSNSSSASYEFNLKKDKLLKEIQKKFPEIEKIKIQIK